MQSQAPLSAAHAPPRAIATPPPSMEPKDLDPAQPSRVAAESQPPATLGEVAGLAELDVSTKPDSSSTFATRPVRKKPSVPDYKTPGCGFYGLAGSDRAVVKSPKQHTLAVAGGVSTGSSPLSSLPPPDPIAELDNRV